MSKRYLVTRAPHYIGQRMVYPDRGAESIVTLPPEIKPGRWLIQVEDAAQAGAESQGSSLFAARHIGAGNWVAEKIADGERASVMFKKADGEAKEKAEAEAERLNAGGEIVLVITDDALSSGQDDPPAGASSGQLPDA